MAVEIVRAVDGGGAFKFRRADVQGTEVRNLIESQLIYNLDDLLDFVGEDLLPETKGIAYAMAGDVEQDDPETRRDLIHISPNAHFLDRVCLATETKKAVDLESDVSNDMEAAVTGMAALLSDEKCFLGITWSSGIGARYWKDGQIVCPAEVGHMILDVSPFALPCSCKKRGHFEAVIGGKAIECRVADEVAARGWMLPRGNPCAFLDKEFSEGEQWAVDLYRMIGKGMGILLANLRCCYDFPLVVWKGKFAFKALEALEPFIREAMEKVLINPTWALEMRFQMSPAPNNEDALIGAASVFWEMVDR